MPFKIVFWSDVGGFWEGKWRQVGTKIDQKSMPVAKRDFLLNRALPAAGARKMGFRGSKLGAKTDQKSIKIWSPRWGASWHRFLMHFCRFWEASWEGKSSQDRLKIDPKRHRKKSWKKREFRMWSWQKLKKTWKKREGTQRKDMYRYIYIYIYVYIYIYI